MMTFLLCLFVINFVVGFGFLFTIMTLKIGPKYALMEMLRSPAVAITTLAGANIILPAFVYSLIRIVISKR